MSDWNRINEPYQEDKWLNKVKQLEAENANLRKAGNALAEELPYVIELLGKLLTIKHGLSYNMNEIMDERDAILTKLADWRAACDE